MRCFSSLTKNFAQLSSFSAFFIHFFHQQGINGILQMQGERLPIGFPSDFLKFCQFLRDVDNFRGRGVATGDGNCKPLQQIFDKVSSWLPLTTSQQPID